MTAKGAHAGEERSVVVGMSGATGLAIVRALHAVDVEVLALHHDATVPGFATGLAACRLCPDWRRDAGAFINVLLATAREWAVGGGRASLFVADDAALDIVWRARDELRTAGLITAFSFARPPADAVDKRTQALAAQAAGVDVPWTEWAAAGGDTKDAAGSSHGAAADGIAGRAAGSSYPLLVKPAVSHAGVAAIGAKAIRCEDAAELRGALARAAQLGVEVVVQEFVPGDDDQLFTVGVFRGGGRALVFTGRKLKQHPPTLGIARLAEALEVPDIVAGSVRLCAELGYEGVAQVEYKRDARDGVYRLMEVNFRPWTWIGLATACGVPLVAAAHAWALGGVHEATWPEPDETARERESARGVRADRGLPLQQGRGRWLWALPEAAYTLRGLGRGQHPDLSQWRGIKAEAFFSRRDPAPFRRAVAAPVTRRLAVLDRRLARVKRGLDRLARPPAFVLNAGAFAARARRERARSPLVGLPPGDRVLVLAPHPDDETIMCGATLAAAARRGDAVRVVAVTSGGATEVGGRRTASGDASPGVREPAIDSVGALREAELRAAAAELGVRDVVFLHLDDDDVTASRGRLAGLLAAQLREFAPSDVYVPFPYDVHPDHVATALALGDALRDALAAAKSGTAAPPPGEPAVHCGFVQTPASPGWITRVVPAGRHAAAKRRAVRAHASRGTAIFAKPLQLAWFNPGAIGRRSEAFVDLGASRYTALCAMLEREGFTRPSIRSPWHPLFAGYEFERTRVERAHISAALRSAAGG